MSGNGRRPAVVVDPARKLGEPILEGTRVTAHTVADAVWTKGLTAAEAALHFGIDRRQVLVACWYVVRFSRTDHQRKTWRARWGDWATVAEPELAREQWQRVADPWSPNRPGTTE